MHDWQDTRDHIQPIDIPARRSGALENRRTAP